METERELISHRQMKGRIASRLERERYPEKLRTKTRLATQRYRLKLKRKRWCNPEVLQEVFRWCSIPPAKPVRPRKEWFQASAIAEERRLW